jgi:hypothetical protein
MKLCAWVFVVIAAGCTARPTQPPDPSQMRYPGEFVAGPELARRGDFLTRQALVGRHGEREFHGEVVVQKRGEAVTLIGVTPFGGKAFVVQQDAGGVRGQELMKGTLPFPPEFMLLDVHRSLFMELAEGTGDGRRRGERAGEAITEEWAGGKLLRRTFRRLDRRPRGEITVEYVGGRTGEQPPKVMKVVNGWFGYSVEITTVSWQAL